MTSSPWIAAAALTVATALGIGGAPANDSSMQLGAGGLELVRDRDITMASERLFVSAELITVDYRFRNAAAHPKSVHIGFPLPRLDMAEALGCANTDFPTRERANFLDFSVRVDGREIAYETQAKAWAAGREITGELRRLDLPFNVPGQALIDALKALPKRELDRLVALKAVTTEGCDGLQPIWTAETIFHWQQHFPANGELAIAHRYRPVVGSGFLGLDDFKNPTLGLDRYCVDAATRRAMARSRVKDSDAVGAMKLIEYVLVTANSWAGPIGEFTLIVDKGAARNIVSFCGEGIRKTGPTTFEMTRRNFRPTRDLHVLILEPAYN